MASYREIGIPVRKVEIGEGALLLNILTRYHSMVNANAPGARKLKSRKRGNFELGALSKFSFAEGKSSDVMVEAELKESFASLRNTKSGRFLIMRMCKLADKLFVDDDGSGFKLLLDTLRFSNSVSSKLKKKAEEKRPALEKLIEVWFEYSALRLAGLVDLLADAQIPEVSPKEGVKVLAKKGVRKRVKKSTAPVLMEIFKLEKLKT